MAKFKEAPGGQKTTLSDTDVELLSEDGSNSVWAYLTARFNYTVTKLEAYATTLALKLVTILNLGTSKQSFTLTGSNPSQSINLDNGSYISIDVTGASGTLTLSFTNPKNGGSYFIRIRQATTKLDVVLPAGTIMYDGSLSNTITGVNSTNMIFTLLYDSDVDGLGTPYFFCIGSAYKSN